MVGKKDNDESYFSSSDLKNEKTERAHTASELEKLAEELKVGSFLCGSEI